MDLSNRDGRRILGDRIKRAAKDAGLSLDDLAVRIGCSRALIYQYASGASLVQPDRLQQIAAVVGKPLSSFFEESIAGGSRGSKKPAPVDQPAVVDGGRAADRHGRVTYLRELIGAYSSSPEWRRVADTCQQLLALIEDEAAPDEIARYLSIHGGALLRLQEFGEAKTKLEEAGALYRELGMVSESLDCLQSIGSADVHLGRSRQALTAFRRVADGAEWRHRWQGTLSIGAVHEMLGDYSAAAESLLRTQEIIGENTDARETEAAYLYVDGNWANLELAWGDFDRALETAERCVNSAQRLGDQDQYVEGLLNRSSARLGLGFFRDAGIDALGAVNVAQLVRDYERWSLALASRSLASNAAGVRQSAIVDAKEALSIALRHHCHRAEMVAQKALATAYLTGGNLVEARYHVDQATASAEAGSLSLPHIEFKVVGASTLRAEGRIAEAREMAVDALAKAVALKAKQPQHDASLCLAEIAADAGEWASALDYASAASTIASEMGAEWLLWRSEATRAEAFVQKSDLEAAGVALAASVRSIDLHRQRCQDAAGSDTLPELEVVKEVWLRWFFYLESMGRGNDAAEFVVQIKWEPLAGWIEEKRDAG